jgi:hypothetical protein
MLGNVEMLALPRTFILTLSTVLHLPFLISFFLLSATLSFLCYPTDFFFDHSVQVTFVASPWLSFWTCISLD